MYTPTYFKDFDTWNTLKKKLTDEVRKTNIRAGEVRWISCGVNVGSEIDGKGVSFTRPALVLHVIGSASLWSFLFPPRSTTLPATFHLNSKNGPSRYAFTKCGSSPSSEFLHGKYESRKSGLKKQKQP
jgi:hypothetical protein